NQRKWSDGCTKAGDRMDSGRHFSCSADIRLWCPRWNGLEIVITVVTGSTSNIRGNPNDTDPLASERHDQSRWNTSDRRCDIHSALSARLLFNHSLSRAAIFHASFAVGRG